MNPKKLKPGLVASYDLRPGNDEDYPGFDVSYISRLLAYLDTYPLIYSPGTHTGMFSAIKLYVNLYTFHWNYKKPVSTFQYLLITASWNNYYHHSTVTQNQKATTKNHQQWRSCKISKNGMQKEQVADLEIYNKRGRKVKVTKAEPWSKMVFIQSESLKRLAVTPDRNLCRMMHHRHIVTVVFVRLWSSLTYLLTYLH